MSKLTVLKILTIGILPLLIVVGFVVYFTLPSPETEKEVVQEEIIPVIEEIPFAQTQTIGTSIEGRNIETVTFGNGAKDLLFVGGMHGGYEWNSTLLAYQMITYLTDNPSVVPDGVTVHIIPTINPDGLYAGKGLVDAFAITDVPNPSVRVAKGRFNANKVDLNRNFGCKWQPESTWRGKTVSAGSEAFSEPEAKALRDYITEIKPEAVVFWHSKANNVYASECENGVLPATLALMSTYAQAADYGEVEKFDAYPITGDAEGWLASIGIPAVTVEFESGTDTEWTRNLAGVRAVLKMYSTIN